jgi:uroporphyrinogen-III synthase
MSLLLINSKSNRISLLEKELRANFGDLQILSTQEVIINKIPDLFDRIQLDKKVIFVFTSKNGWEAYLEQIESFNGFKSVIYCFLGAIPENFPIELESNLYSLANIPKNYLELFEMVAFPDNHIYWFTGGYSNQEQVMALFNERNTKLEVINTYSIIDIPFDEAVLNQNFEGLIITSPSVVESLIRQKPNLKVILQKNQIFCLGKLTADKIIELNLGLPKFPSDPQINQLIELLNA